MSSLPISTTLSLHRSIIQSRETLADLQRQLAEGKRVTTYGGLGVERTTVLSLRSELGQIGGYRASIEQADLRLDVMLQSLGRIRTLAAESRASGLEVGFDLSASGQTVYQIEAAAHFDEVVALLNTSIGDRHLFGGRETEGRPVQAAKLILDGGGGRAGFRQIVEERRQADLGGDGRGRLSLAALNETVTVAEDTGPFGFKLAAVSSSLAGATVTGPAGVPAQLEVAFGPGLPQDGDTIRLTLALPDGTTTDITMTARTGAPAAPGQFQIGADGTATAANFEAALGARIEQEARSVLTAASAFAAAGDFFDFDEATPPQRVDGPPFDTASALRDATPADTVFWYQGEVAASPARQSALVKADDSLVVAYGARANEEAFRTALKHMAVVATAIFDATDPDDPARYAAMRQRATAALSFPAGSPSVQAVETEMTAAKVTLGRAAQAHTAGEILLKSTVDDAEKADPYEVSAQILALQTRLEASLQVTALLGRLSLVNFL